MVSLEGVKGNSARDFVMVDNVWRSIEGLTQQSTWMITPIGYPTQLRSYDLNNLKSKKLKLFPGRILMAASLILMVPFQRQSGLSLAKGSIWTIQKMGR